MNDGYDTVLIGATYFAIGYAAAHAHCLILEETQVAGSDFHLSFRPAFMTERDERWRNDDLGCLMTQFGVWKENTFDVLKAALVIDEYAAQFGVRKLGLVLDAKVLEIEGDKAGYTVTYLTNNGIQKARAAHVLDTTAERITSPASAACHSKALMLYTLLRQDENLSRIADGFPGSTVNPGFQPHEYVIRVPVDLQMTLAEAYGEVADRWRGIFPRREERLLMLGRAFDAEYTVRQEDKAVCPWINRRFFNPIEAFSSGKAYQLSGKEMKS